MGLHRLLGFTTAVPDPEGLAAFYGELGLGGSPTRGSRGATVAPAVLVDEGEFRRLVRVEFGCDGPEDLDAVARRLADGGATPVVGDGEVRVVDAGEPRRARRAGGRSRPGARSRSPSSCRTPPAPRSGPTSGLPPCSASRGRRGASVTS